MTTFDDQAEVLERIREWARVHGEPPRQDDWRKGPIKPSLVHKLFGSWNNAIAAAGFTPRRAARPRGSKGIPNKPLREAFKESPLSVSEVALAAGFVSPNGTVDTSRLKRLLGMEPSTGNGKSKAYYRTKMAEKDAAAIADALGRLPTELGF